MKISLALGVLVFCVTTVFAAPTNAGFGLDGFNRSVSAATRGNAVFSPVSFELDCVIFSEAFDALIRAKIAETMGVLNGLEPIYQPIAKSLDEATDKKLSFLHARAFCVHDERKAHAAYRQWLQRTFSAEMFSSDFHYGANSWFRARMDGEMEDFSLPDASAPQEFYSYFDLVSVRSSWKEAFPTNNTREIKFTRSDGSSCAVRAMCDLRNADIWKKKNVTIMRLPLEGDAWFFAMLPAEGLSVRDIRGELSSVTLNDIVRGITSVTESGIAHGPAAIAIPTIDITSEVDLKTAFSYFNFPLSGMDRMEKSIRPKFIRQRVRYRLDECGLNPMIAEKPTDQQTHASVDTLRFVLNRPFLFFIYHDPTATIPIVGQYTGQ